MAHSNGGHSSHKSHGHGGGLALAALVRPWMLLLFLLFLLH